ncbi:MAG: hypothetical protein ACTSV5_12440 [Promethearchaeota archaeon]
MIDEEEDDEILKKGVSFKKVLKNAILIGLIIVGALFIYMGGTNQMTNFFLGFSFICVGSTLIQIQKQEEEPTRQTLSILKCENCEVTKVRNYEAGDFVFKSVDSCENCDEKMKIKQIYSVKLKKSTAKKQAKEASLKNNKKAKI